MKKNDMREYRIWKAMKARCYAPSCKNMGYYQKDNITVCDRWRHNFYAFLEDMGEMPGKGYSIERIDYMKGYSPENCKWIPHNQQSRNRRNVLLFEYNGETRPLKEWARILKVNYDTLIRRIKKGVAFEKAIQPTPFRYVEINGRKQYISDWCREIGVSAAAIYSWKYKHKATAKEAVMHYLTYKEDEEQ